MKKHNTMTLICASAGMLVLILDGKTALSGARAGVELCLKTLIPSLFPFFILSILLTGTLVGQSAGVLRPLGKLCRIPQGAESLLAVGLLGGYPVGAQNVALACRAGKLSQADGARMLAFCNNAGPAFLFGIIGPMFSSPKLPWLLWGIHIFSALAVGMILPGGDSTTTVLPAETRISIQEALEKSVKVMALVCGWVILFRMLLTILDRWLFWALPVSAQVALAGLLELSNGCVQLIRIDSEGLRFVIAAVLLAFGGLCVTMQTASVAKGIPLSLYFPGKLLQALISFLLAAICQMCFPTASRWSFPAPFLAAGMIICGFALLFLRRQKKSSSIPAASGV